ncbi:MAG: hypothetical protein IPM96_12685 [Ignavibacteria bacterium]|nr:hypothetical protein [Ignavibacteria bacterium]
MRAEIASSGKRGLAKKLFESEAISESYAVLEFYNNSSAVRAEIASSEKRGLAKEL